MLSLFCVAGLAAVAGAYPAVLNVVLSSDHVFQNLRGTGYDNKQIYLRCDCK
jgi:hypothetical protein